MHAHVFFNSMVNLFEELPFRQGGFDLPLGISAFQFTCCAYTHQLYIDSTKRGFERGLRLIKAMRPTAAPRTPEGASHIALGHHLLEHHILREQMANVPGKRTDSFPYHIAAGGILEGIGYIVLEFSVEVNSHRPGGQAISLQRRSMQTKSISRVSAR